MVMIAAGNMRNLVEVKRYTETRTATGGVTSTEVTTKIYANVKPMRGRRALEYQQIVNGQPYEIMFRWFDRDQVKTGDVIVWNGLDIQVHTKQILDENIVTVIGAYRGT